MEYGLVVRWLVAFLALGAVGVPLAARLFRRSATRGVGFALPVSALTLGLVAFWIGRAAFGPVAVAAGLLVLLALAAGVLLERGALRDGTVRLDDDAVDGLPDRQIVAETAAVFAVAFLFVVVIRAFDPGVDPSAGEKFLDYGLLKSLLRAGALPPEDMWFAGEPVRYYYGGHLLAALFTTLTATPARFGYNLALAGFFGMLVAAVYDLAGSVAASRGRSRRTAGLLAAFLVGLGANLHTAGWVFLRALSPGARGTVAGVFGFDPGETVARDFSYWTASRVIPGTINEFPLFAWLNGDLHAHMTMTPFLLLGAALAFALYRAPASETRRRRLLLFGAVPLVGGFQVVLDTWSVPSVFGLAWLALAAAPAAPRTLLTASLRRRLDALFAAAAADGGDGVEQRRLPEELSRPVVAAVLVAGAGVLAVAVAAPFLLVAVAGGGSERTLALLPVEMRSSLGELSVVHGAFFATFVAGLLGAVGRERPLPVVVGGAALMLAGLAVGLPALGLFGVVLVAGWVALRTDRAGFETVLIVGGAGLALIVEVVYLNEQAGPGRMNTVFKTYAQVWPLWAAAAGVVLTGLLRAVPRPDASLLWPSAGTRDVAASLFVAGLLVSTGMYAAFAVPAHVSEGYPEEPTLDGTDFVETFHPSEARAIDWLDAREGQPAVLSAPATGVYPGADSRYGHSPAMYRWDASPAASLTGLPTVAGWHHEVGYRGPDAYFARVRTVDGAYTSRAAAVEVFREYDVRYVWVGPAERDRYEGRGMIDFSSIDGVEVVEEASTPTAMVFRVTESELPPASSLREDDEEQN
jgi:YYY domain-containing protein